MKVEYTMPKPIEILQEIINRHCETDENVDLGNEFNHYFYFDRIQDDADLDRAWSVFPQGADIRRRLTEVDACCNVIDGWGYRVPRLDKLCSDDELFSLVRSHIKSWQPFLYSHAGWDLLPGDYAKMSDEAAEALQKFGDGDFEVQLAPPGVEFHVDSDNPLLDFIFAAIGEVLIDKMDFDQPENDLLYNWAIYMTKVDEVAAYLLWPCVNQSGEFGADVPNAGFQLWQQGCEQLFWIKDGDPASRTVYVRRPDPEDDEDE